MAKFETNAVKYMVDLIRDFKFADFQAAGIVGNGGYESGGFTKLQEINPTAGRGGYGDFMWTGPRRVEFENWLARNAMKGWTVDTYEANYSFLFRELVGPESATVPAVKATKTLEEATQVFMEKFERPGVPALPGRIEWAKKAFDAFKASGVDPNVIVAEPRPGEMVQPQVPSLMPILSFIQEHPEIIQMVLGLFVPKPGQPGTGIVPTAPAPANTQFEAQLRAIAAVLVPVAVTALSTTGVWGRLAAGVLTMFTQQRR